MRVWSPWAQGLDKSVCFPQIGFRIVTIFSILLMEVSFSFQGAFPAAEGTPCLIHGIKISPFAADTSDNVITWRWNLHRFWQVKYELLLVLAIKNSTRKTSCCLGFSGIQIQCQCPFRLRLVTEMFSVVPSSFFCPFLRIVFKTINYVISQ